MVAIIVKKKKTLSVRNRKELGYGPIQPVRILVFLDIFGNSVCLLDHKTSSQAKIFLVPFGLSSESCRTSKISYFFIANGPCF